MPVGDSGRVVIEIDPATKKQLHQLLRSDGLNMKDWFLQNAEAYFESKAAQQKLFDESGKPIRRAS